MAYTLLTQVESILKWKCLFVSRQKLWVYTTWTYASYASLTYLSLILSHKKGQYDGLLLVLMSIYNVFIDLVYVFEIIGSQSVGSPSAIRGGKCAWVSTCLRLWVATSWSWVARSETGAFRLLLTLLSLCLLLQNHTLTTSFSSLRAVATLQISLELGLGWRKKWCSRVSLARALIVVRRLRLLSEMPKIK